MHCSLSVDVLVRESERLDQLADLLDEDGIQRGAHYDDLLWHESRFLRLTGVLAEN